MDWKITELRSFFILMLMTVLLLLPGRSFGQNQGALSNPFSSGVPQGQGSFGFKGGGFMPQTRESLPTWEGSSRNEQTAREPTGLPKQTGKKELTETHGRIGLSEPKETTGMTEDGASPAHEPGG